MGQILDAAKYKVMYFAADPDSDGVFNQALNLYAAPVSAFRGFNMESSSGTTQIYLYFEPQRMSGLDTGNDQNPYDRVLLNIATNKHKEVMASIIQAINGDGPKSTGFILIADDMNSKYATSNITSIQSITQTEPA
tara:strand:- start:494 stop:901 length:408 start_codon:yes stop_codon:yes gene_type:complete